MKFLGILRASALFILVSGFHGPRGIFCSNLEVNPSNESSSADVSEDHEDSTVESSSELSSPAPKSNLVFQSSEWNDSHLASAVLFLQEFCKEVKAEKFNGKISEAEYDDVSRACKDLSLNFKNFVEFFSPTHGHEALTEGKELCTSYKGVLNPEEFRVYAKWLVDNIPEVIKSMINMHNDSLKYSKVFLTDKLAGSLKYGFVFKGGWWRHFTSMDKFRCIVEEYLAAMESLLASLNKVLEHSAQEPTKSFNNINADSLAQSDLVFENFSWHDSMLASAVLFIQEFCKELKAEKFNGKLSEDKSEGLLEACGYISSYLEFFVWPLVPTYGPGSVAERNKIDMNFYKNVLKPEDFDVYAKWIVKNTFKIRDSLIGMLLESLDMSETQLKTETSVGPSKYGFVFHCDGHHDKVNFAFKHATKRLALSLQLLQNCLGEKPTEVKIEKVLRQLEGKRKAKHEKLMKEIAEKRTKLVERLSNSDAPFSLEDMEPFLGVL